VSKPAIVAVDDDPVVAAAITRDLRGRYSDNYRVVRARSGREGAMPVYFVHRYLATV
jgi:thioredoxin reductase (NADPH)